jgi:hypothetical protein
MKKEIYEVSYYTLEPSYYENSERNYVVETFKTREEALNFVEEARKRHPAQIVVKVITEEFLLDLRNTDNYKDNRAAK